MALSCYADLDAATSAAALFVAEPEAQCFGVLLERLSVRVWHFRSAYRHAVGQTPQR